MKEILGRERQDRRREVSIWQSWMSLNFRRVFWTRDIRSIAMEEQ